MGTSALYVPEARVSSAKTPKAAACSSVIGFPESSVPTILYNATNDFAASVSSFASETTTLIVSFMCVVPDSAIVLSPALTDSTIGALPSTMRLPLALTVLSSREPPINIGSLASTAWPFVTISSAMRPVTTESAPVAMVAVYVFSGVSSFLNAHGVASSSVPFWSYALTKDFDTSVSRESSLTVTLILLASAYSTTVAPVAFLRLSTDPPL